MWPDGTLTCEGSNHEDRRPSWFESDNLTNPNGHGLNLFWLDTPQKFKWESAGGRKERGKGSFWGGRGS